MYYSQYVKGNQACRFYRPENPQSCRNGDNCPFAHINPENITRTIDNRQEPRKNFAVSVNAEGGRKVVFDSKYKYVARKAEQSNPPTSVTSAHEKTPSVNPISGGMVSTTESNVRKPKLDDSYYTPKELLGNDDISAYEAKEFTDGFIPMLPPPRYLA